MQKETASEITQRLAKLDQEFDERRKAALEPARRRLDEVRQQRANLEKEEEELLDILGEAKTGVRRRRKGGKRMTALHKKEVISRFLREGHIKNNTSLTKELRTALTDEGFGVNDFRKLNDYLPNGWESRSNGLRGTAAKTTFHAV